ncbi:DUF2244 domain-containing protein [Pseudohalocynthiibacter aestuariivivens]|uniref:DUF2244 domain-containing protein n=1 Tax=Pseudohalocynthiibacter aestuariivivens TaxID=1591409 RepID=A0ABV5JJA9_9RHOB|nr:DUF2244 domain-containing protein [Pseudohalocynthiibacter aestuariivivens]MCK0101833.1 DUF2244 domain-containing protein [Pseudohalocynthiibacter sp. F2068]
MPYEWTGTTKEASGKSGASYAFSDGHPPVCTLSLWPFRSLPKRGFVIFIAATCILLLLPLLPLLGTPFVWTLLPFLLGAVALIWYFLNRSYCDGELLELLSIWPDRIELIRHNPRGPQQEWSANPHWVRVQIHPASGPVPSYVTLTGEGREVEIGAFLSEDERKALFTEINEQLSYLRP